LSKTIRFSDRTQIANKKLETIYSWATGPVGERSLTLSSKGVPMNLDDQIVFVLSQAKRPMSVDEIVSKLEETFGPMPWDTIQAEFERNNPDWDWDTNS
jgi:hypothetical protein